MSGQSDRKIQDKLLLDRERSEASAGSATTYKISVQWPWIVSETRNGTVGYMGHVLHSQGRHIWTN